MTEKEIQSILKNLKKLTVGEVQRTLFESKIFDKYGNYSFPTDIKMESPNNVCGTTESIKMDCLTKDLKTPYTDVKDCIDRENIVLTKLKHFEDIEEELGIDLITLFKALKEGFYVKKDSINEGFISLVKAKDIREVDMITKSITLFNYEFVYFKDYGKTWALSKEELEMEK